MVERNTCPRLTTAFVLLAVWLVMTRAKSYQKFLREHVDYPMTEVPAFAGYCDIMMKRRHMANPYHCKHLNTFLHADVSQIQAVCGQGGEPTTGDLRESDTSFPLTLCKLQRGSWAPNCRYEEINNTERIIIACEDGYPVHLETEVPNYGGFDI